MSQYHKTIKVDGHVLDVYRINDGPWAAQCDQCGWPLAIGDTVYYHSYYNKYFCCVKCFRDFISDQLNQYI